MIKKFCSLILIFGAMPAWGQTGSRQITVEQAVQEALEKNLGILAERFNLTVAEARIYTARLRPNPVLTVSGAFPGPSIYDAGISQRDGVIRADFLLERGGKRSKRIGMADRAKGVVQLQLMDATRGLILDVQNACVEVLAVKSSLMLARENLKNFESLVDINSVRVKAGDLAKVELVRSQIAALQFKNAVIQGGMHLSQSLTRLQNLTGKIPAVPDFDVVGELRRDFPLLSLGELQNHALERRPDLLAIRKDLERSQADLQLQIAQSKVDFTLSPEYHRQQGAAGEASSISGNMVALSFSSPLPFFNRNQGEIQRARQEGRQLEARVKARENDIRTEVESVFLQVQTASRLLESLERDMMAQAREVREIMDYSYRQGEASLVELLDAQRAFNDTMQSYNEASADFARNLYLLESVTGNSVK